MTEDNKKTAESVRSGLYFKQSRDWFNAVYIGPISERSLFLIIALLAGVVAVVSSLSVIRMMPLTTKVPVVIYAPDDHEGKVKRLDSLRDSGENLNSALLKHFLSNYVSARESYSVGTLISNGMVIYAHSDPSVYTAYQVMANPQNPQSYFARLGEVAQRKVDVKSVKISDGSQEAATVVFEVEYKGAEDNQKSRWTAKLNYTYTGVETNVVFDEEAGQEVLRASEPKFRVTKYELEKN